MLIVTRHTPNSGAANIQGGVTIDMQTMNQVVVSSDRKIVSIGPGNRWGNIYPKLDELNLVMIGGRLSTVGTGGLISGGKWFYMRSFYSSLTEHNSQAEYPTSRAATGSHATPSKNSKSCSQTEQSPRPAAIQTRHFTALSKAAVTTSESSPDLTQHCIPRTPSGADPSSNPRLISPLFMNILHGSPSAKRMIRTPHYYSTSHGEPASLSSCTISPIRTETRHGPHQPSHLSTRCSNSHLPSERLSFRALLTSSRRQHRALMAKTTSSLREHS